jgi:DNA-directed RNA polymerase specialized sigma24 family protein
MEALDKLDFYYKELITQYFLNKLTFSQMNKKYGITLNSLHKDMKKAIKKIQQHCKHFITDDTI